MKMKKLLANPDAWTQGKYARDAYGKEVHVDSPKATCWCLEGAFIKCYPRNNRKIFKKLVNKIQFIVNWNDAPERTHQDVINVLNELDI